MPERRCIATGKSQPTDGLIRFVVAPDGTVTPDLEERLPGRGLWISADRAAIEKAAAKGLFSRAAKQSVQVPDSLADMVAGLLVKKCQQRLGLARRAGFVTLGFEKTKAALKTAAHGLLIEAADASPDQAGKIRGLAQGLSVIKALTRDELGEALGRDFVVHGLIVGPGKITDGLERDLQRLQGLRQTD